MLYLATFSLLYCLEASFFFACVCVVSMHAYGLVAGYTCMCGMCGVLKLMSDTAFLITESGLLSESPESCPSTSQILRLQEVAICIYPLWGSKL